MGKLSYFCFRPFIVCVHYQTVRDCLNYTCVESLLKHACMHNNLVGLEAAFVDSPISVVEAAKTFARQVNIHAKIRMSL